MPWRNTTGRDTPPLRGEATLALQGSRALSTHSGTIYMKVHHRMTRNLRYLHNCMIIVPNGDCMCSFK